ncbi:Pkinase-domain-containing protein [Cristinia sonorae]|uniref:non-specific serine/threonine protein kinase n=1 Tax=Cristinia sonorae TaxID=1940300 RepID=A0A8K0URA5_9AGAR|nr:Pkinase-domain-containing protein [Cristinia sonorae]
MVDSTETAQTEGEGPEGSDKPPHGDIATQAPRITHVHQFDKFMNGIKNKHQTSSKSSAPAATASRSRRSSGAANGNASAHASIPLPPPNNDAYQKSPGHTKRDLEQLSKSTQLALGGAPQDSSSSTTGSMTPSNSDSPSPPESECWSVPSTQPPSRAASRAPSFSTGKSGGKVEPPKQTKKDSERTPTGHKISPTPSAGGESTRKGPPSVHSDAGGQKFTLKDLLGAPKLVRRSSARSTGSSKKSDSERGGRSVGGETTASLLKKYGVCEKVAIGKGATSVVRLAHKWDRTEEKLYAVKEFRKRRKNETEKEYVKKLTAEFCISSTLHHINIVETVDLVQDENQHWCEVMEFCPGGDLYAAIKRGGMSPSEVECCFRQILTGVSYLHEQGVAHRDIKPENLFFDTKGHLKIGDYGASTVYRLPWEQTIHMSTGLCGSEPYIAPEQFLGKPYDARLVDIWACGIVYYCLHFQELPWTVAQPTDPLFAAYASACNSAASAQASCPPTISNLSPRSCRAVIRKMLEPNPKLRSPIEEIMQQQWIQGIEVCHTVPKPSHVHVYAQAMAQAQVHVVS